MGPRVVGRSSRGHRGGRPPAVFRSERDVLGPVLDGGLNGDASVGLGVVGLGARTRWRRLGPRVRAACRGAGGVLAGTEVAVERGFPYRVGCFGMACPAPALCGFSPLPPGCDASAAVPRASAVVAHTLGSAVFSLVGDGAAAGFDPVCPWCARGGRDPHSRRSRLTQHISGGGRRGQEEPDRAERSKLRSSPLDAGGRPALAVGR